MAETEASKTRLKPREGFEVISASLSFGSRYGDDGDICLTGIVCVG